MSERKQFQRTENTEFNNDLQYPQPDSQKLKKVFKKIRSLISIVIVIAVVAAGVVFYLKQPKSIADEVAKTIIFEGYDREGTAKLGNYQAIIDKYSKAPNEKVTVELNSKGGLRNGKKIRLSITAGKATDIKSEDKEIKVSGLKKVKEFNTDDLKKLVKEHPITFTGINGRGKLILPTDEQGIPYFRAQKIIKPLPTDPEDIEESTYYNDRRDELTKEDSYLNGDEVKIQLSLDYQKKLKAQGYDTDQAFVDTNVKVSNLKPFSAFTNLKEVGDKIHLLAQTEYPASSYDSITLEPKKSFILCNGLDTNPSVYYNTLQKISFSAITLYRIEIKNKSGINSVKYEYIGFTNISTIGDSLNIADVDTSNSFNHASLTSNMSYDDALFTLKEFNPGAEEVSFN